MLPQTCLITSLFSATALILQLERDKKDLFNIAGAGATIGLVCGLPQGPRIAGKYMLGATILSVSFGSFQQIAWCSVLTPYKALCCYFLLGIP